MKFSVIYKPVPVLGWHAMFLSPGLKMICTISKTPFAFQKLEGKALLLLNHSPEHTLAHVLKLKDRNTGAKFLPKNITAHII
jgi:hypothetical protein